MEPDHPVQEREQFKELPQLLPVASLRRGTRSLSTIYQMVFDKITFQEDHAPQQQRLLELLRKDPRRVQRRHCQVQWLQIRTYLSIKGSALSSEHPR